jgi:hypothetical protein
MIGNAPVNMINQKQPRPMVRTAFGIQPTAPANTQGQMGGVVPPNTPAGIGTPMLGSNPMGTPTPQVNPGAPQGGMDQAAGRLPDFIRMMMERFGGK